MLAVSLEKEFGLAPGTEAEDSENMIEMERDGQSKLAEGKPHDAVVLELEPELADRTSAGLAVLQALKRTDNKRKLTAAERETMKDRPGPMGVSTAI